MKIPDIPANEGQRIEILHSLSILDTQPEERFDRLTRMAKQIFAVPITLVSLVDESRQWFKSCIGLEAYETSREISFCGHSILEKHVFVVPDTLLDPRFIDNPLVTDSPNIHSMGADNALAGNFSAPFAIIDEDTSFMVDFAWALPFKLGSTSWSFEGHAEYIEGRTQVNNFGSTELESWILIQPQIRLDIGELIGLPAQRLFAGIEYQYWKNKLGTKGLDDNTAQFLAVWRF